MRVQLKKEFSSSKGVQGWLKAERAYVVLAVEYQSQTVSYRIAADNGTPALFEAGLFSVLDSSVDPGWIVRHPGETQSELVPREWSREGFWADYFDDDPEVVAAYQEVLDRMSSQ